MRRTAVLCAALLALAGCKTTMVTQAGGRTIVHNLNESKDFEDTPEGKLYERAKENPDSPRAWWQLGDHYEEQRRFTQAIAAYEKMLEATKKQTKKTGVEYTAPYYLLGRCHALIHSWQGAIGYLKQVVKMQPKDVRQAYSNVDFRESHYLLGAIYYEHSMFEDAEAHLITFQELTRNTDHRADGMLLEIEQALRPEKARSFRRDDAPTRPAGKVKPDKGGTVTVQEPAPPK